MRYTRFSTIISGFIYAMIILVVSFAPLRGNDEPVVLKVLYYDDDCLPDTLMGIRTTEGLRKHTIPTSIKWGWGSCSVEENGIRKEIPSSGFKETVLRFPHWNSLSVGLFHDNLSNDKVQDLAFLIKGKNERQKDTSRYLVIFGQPVLKNIPVLDISLIDTNAQTPCIVRELRKGETLTNPQKHDLSGGTFWAVNTFDLSPQKEEQALRKSVSDFSLSPNPATSYTEISSLHTMPAGIYDIELYDGLGRRIMKRTITLQYSGDVRSRLDLQNLATGYYTLRVFSGGNEVADLIFMIIR